jgi:hypothetical protein
VALCAAPLQALLFAFPGLLQSYFLGADADGAGDEAADAD